MLTKLSQGGFSQPVLGDCCLCWSLNPRFFPKKPHFHCGWLFPFYLYGMAPHSSPAWRSLLDAFPFSRVSFWLAGLWLDPAAQALHRFLSKLPYLWLSVAGGMLPALEHRPVFTPSRCSVASSGLPKKCKEGPGLQAPCKPHPSTWQG